MVALRYVQILQLTRKDLSGLALFESSNLSSVVDFVVIICSGWSLIFFFCSNLVVLSHALVVKYVLSLNWMTGSSIPRALVISGCLWTSLLNIAGFCLMLM